MCTGSEHRSAERMGATALRQGASPSGCGRTFARIVCAHTATLTDAHDLFSFPLKWKTLYRHRSFLLALSTMAWSRPQDQLPPPARGGRALMAGPRQRRLSPPHQPRQRTAPSQHLRALDRDLSAPRRTPGGALSAQEQAVGTCLRHSPPAIGGLCSHVAMMQ